MEPGQGSQRAIFNCVFTTSSLRYSLTVNSPLLSVQLGVLSRLKRRATPHLTAEPFRRVTREPYALGGPCHSTLSPAPANTQLLSVSVGLPFLDGSYKWNPELAFCVWTLSQHSVVMTHAEAPHLKTPLLSEARWCPTARTQCASVRQ